MHRQFAEDHDEHWQKRVLSQIGIHGRRLIYVPPWGSFKELLTTYTDIQCLSATQFPLFDVQPSSDSS